MQPVTFFSPSPSVTLPLVVASCFRSAVADCSPKRRAPPRQRDPWNLPMGTTQTFSLRRSIPLRLHCASYVPPRSIPLPSRKVRDVLFPPLGKSLGFCFGYGSRVKDSVWTLRACAFANPATLAVAPNSSLTSDRSRYAMSLRLSPTTPKPRLFRYALPPEVRLSAARASPVELRTANC